MTNCVLFDMPWTERIPTCEAGYLRCPDDETCKGFTGITKDVNTALSAGTADNLSKEDLIEAGAEIAHSQWSGWMAYLFSKCEIHEDGTASIPEWAVSRWKRQMNTSYVNLPEEEKVSDQEEAKKYMNWLLKVSTFEGK